MTRSALALTAVLTLIVLAAPAAAAAATNTFQGPGSAWNGAGNWSQGSVPDPTDDVVIPSSRSVVLDTTAGVGNSLDLDGSLQVNGTTLTLGAGSSSLGGSTLSVTGGGAVNLGAMTTWSAGQISFSSGGGTLHVGPGDVLDITGAGLSSLNFQGGVWRNDGTINRTTSATIAQIGVPFENDGAVNVNSGTLNLGQGTGAGSSSGDYLAAAGAELLFAGGNHAVTGAGARVGGPGSVRITLNALSMAAGATFDPAALTLAGGNLELAPDATVTSLTATSGTRSGAGRLTVTGLASIGSLNLAGGATTNLTGTAQFTASLNITGGHTLEMPPAATWSAGQIAFNSGGGTLHVGPGDVLDITGANLSSLNFNGGLWRNDGTINRTTSATTAQIGVPLENTGTIDVDTGTLALDQGLTQTAGVSDVASGATLGGSLSIQGGTLRGAGTAGGNVTNSGGTVRPGTSPGQLSIGGNYTQGSGGTLVTEIEGTTPGAQFDRLAVGGTATLDGTLSVLSPAFNPAPADTFEIITATSRAGTFNTVAGDSRYGPRYDAGGVTLLVQQQAPVNTGAPAISGTSTLICSPGTWTGAPSFGFEWLRDGVAIPGITAAEYVPLAADAGRTLTCRVTATNGGGSASATSAGRDIPAAEQPPPPPAPPEPEPEPEPEIQQPPSPQADTRRRCKRDRLAPKTVLRKRNVQLVAGRLTLNGTAKDRPKGKRCRAGVKIVQISVARIEGRGNTDCSFLRNPGRFVLTPPRNCQKPVLLTATGTRRWTMRFGAILAPGEYRIAARATDFNGTKEKPRSGRAQLTVR